MELSTAQQLLIREMITERLIYFGLIPDSHGTFHMPPKATFGGDSLGVKPEVLTMPPSILETVTSERSNSIYKLGVALAELDTLINTLMKLRSDMHRFYSNVRDGVDGLRVVENSDSGDVKLPGLKRKPQEWVRDFDA